MITLSELKQDANEMTGVRVRINLIKVLTTRGKLQSLHIVCNQFPRNVLREGNADNEDNNSNKNINNEMRNDKCETKETSREVSAGLS